MGGLLNSLSHERRAAMAAAVPPGDPALAQLWGFSAVSPSGVVVSPETYRECPECDACVTLLEDTVATLPLDLYERTGPDQRRRVDEHPLHLLLHDRPNAWQTSAEFRAMLEGFVQGYANAYAEIVSGPTGIRALEPLHPLQVYPFRTTTGAVAYRYTPYGGSPRTLLQGEVLHIREHPFQRDMIRGASKVERHREAIGRALATGEYLSRFFSNGAVPKTFLVPQAGQQLNETTREELREQFERKHSGLANAHRVGVLPALLDIKQLGVDNEKAQVIEAYRLSVAQVARIFGVPLHLIGDNSQTVGSGAGGTGIEQQSIGFLTYHMRPKLVRWEQALNAALMSAGMAQRFYFEFNVDGLLRGDFKSRMDGYGVMVQWGLASANEIRRRENLPPVEGGDERLIPLNMVPASRIMDVLLKNAGNDNSPSAQKDAVDAATRALADIVAEYNERGRTLLRAA